MGELKRLVARRPVLAYVVLCYGISWTVWLAIPWVASEWTLVKILTGVGIGPGLAAVLLDRARGTAGALGNRRWWACFAPVFCGVVAIDLISLLAGDGRTLQEAAAAEPVGLVPGGVIGSLLAAAACGFTFACAATSRSPALRSILEWRVPVRWWLIALLLPAALFLAGLGIDLALGGDPPAPVWAGLSAARYAALALRALLFTLLVVAVGEEPGWRGWMLPELQKRFSPLTSTLLVGVVWGLWHFPLFLNGMYPGPPEAIVQYLVIGPVLSVLFTWIYNRTTGVLLLALVLHTAINNTPRFVPGSDAFPVLLIALVVALVLAERMWRRPAPVAADRAPGLSR
ncbi:MAG TPA: CPBP family intramembrane glutamic endopeptidase [Thermoanaerobaculia bacterium]|nr:CPBP family intramembrane glutamic endopeptidase [Thermoanaerobaculia bacterium]